MYLYTAYDSVVLHDPPMGGRCPERFKYNSKADAILEQFRGPVVLENVTVVVGRGGGLGGGDGNGGEGTGGGEG